MLWKEGIMSEGIDKMNSWKSVDSSLPFEGVVVDTKIDDENGVRNEQPLKRQHTLWFFPDGSMYVYYRPTHWKFKESTHEQ